MKKITLLSLIIALTLFYNLSAEDICPSLAEAKVDKLSCKLKTKDEYGSFLRGFFKKGKQDGKWTVYYPDGDLKSTRIYKNGKLNGEVKGYYKNEKIYIIANFKDGKLNGEQKEYYENGNLKNIGNFINGNGKATLYYSNGKIKGIKNYKDGKLIDEN